MFTLLLKININIVLLLDISAPYCRPEALASFPGARRSLRTRQAIHVASRAPRAVIMTSISSCVCLHLQTGRSVAAALTPVRRLPCCRGVVCPTSSSNVHRSWRMNCPPSCSLAGSCRAFTRSPALRGLQGESTLTVPGGSLFTSAKSVQVLHPGCRDLSNWRRTELNCTVSVCARGSFHDSTNNRFDKVCITAFSVTWNSFTSFPFPFPSFPPSLSLPLPPSPSLSLPPPPPPHYTTGEHPNRTKPPVIWQTCPIPRPRLPRAATELLTRTGTLCCCRSQ